MQGKNTVSVGKACPKCRSGLDRSGAAYVCRNCGKEWKDIDGIACFNDMDSAVTYWGFLREDIFKKLMETAGTDYRKALRGIFSEEKDEYIFRYSVSENRADFIEYVRKLETGPQGGRGGGRGRGGRGGRRDGRK